MTMRTHLVAVARSETRDCNRKKMQLRYYHYYYYCYCCCLLLLLLPCRAFLISRTKEPPCTRRRRIPRHCFSSSTSTSTSTTASSTTEQGNGDIVIAQSNSTKTTALALKQQSEQLRAEVLSIQKALNESRALQLQKETVDVDRWIDHILVNGTYADTQMLNTVEYAAQLLRDERFSQEQVFRMFDRICDTSSPQSRSKCSPLLALLVDAAGKLDELDRHENPNKRWSGRVERVLRKRLFAKDYGHEYRGED
jgi:hypothetical protein